MSVYNAGTGQSIYSKITALSNEFIYDLKRANATYNIYNSNTFQTYSYSNSTLNLATSNTNITIGGNYGVNNVQNLITYSGSAVNAVSSVQMLSNLSIISNIAYVSNLYGSSNILNSSYITNAYLTGGENIYNPQIGSVIYQAITQYNNANITNSSNLSINSASLIQNSCNIYVANAALLNSNQIQGVNQVMGNIQYGSISNITNCQLTYNPRVLFTTPVNGSLVDQIQILFEEGAIPPTTYSQSYPLVSMSFQHVTTNGNVTTMLVVTYRASDISSSIFSVSMPIQ